MSLGREIHYYSNGLRREARVSIRFLGILLKEPASPVTGEEYGLAIERPLVHS